jgi:flagellar FliJ protein
MGDVPTARLKVARMTKGQSVVGAFGSSTPVATFLPLGQVHITFGYKCAKMEQSMSRHREFDGALVRPALNNGLTTNPAGTARGTLIRQKQFRIDTARRRVARIEALIADFDRMANALESEIRVERNRAHIHDKGLVARRDNLKRSVDGLKGLLEDTKSELAEAFSEVEETSDLRTMPAQS